MSKSHTDKPNHPQAIIISLANVESSFTSHFALGILGYSNAEIPALLVALNVLNGAELYFWVIIPGSLCLSVVLTHLQKRIRGAGLAYGASASLDVQAGHVSFSAWRVSDSLLPTPVIEQF
jgi:Zn-dependent M16 (insulinase) family peptidase